MVFANVITSAHTVADSVSDFTAQTTFNFNSFCHTLSDKLSGTNFSWFLEQ